MSVRVYKVGGPALEDPGLVVPLAEEVRRGAGHAVLVHGGGRAVDRLLKQLHIESRFVDGRRETSPEAMAVVEMVLSGASNKAARGGAHGRGRAGDRPVGPRRWADARAARARPRARRDAAARGPRAAARAVGAGFLPVVSPVANGPLGEAVNVNADEAALGIARAVGAATLVYLSDVDGVRLGERTAERLGSAEARLRMEDGTIAGGMALKVEVALEAAAAGIPEVVIAGKARLLAAVPRHTHRRRRCETDGAERGEHGDDGASSDLRARPDARQGQGLAAVRQGRPRAGWTSPRASRSTASATATSRSSPPIKKQAERLMHASNLFHTEPASALAERLGAARLPVEGVLHQLGRPRPARAP